MEPVLRYPLILVHGAGFRDYTLGVSYWGRIPLRLKKAGVKVYHGGTDAWGVIETNGEQLKRTILRVLEETGAGKVNILAHSRGGLEARYVIHSLGMAGKVASLTTISTPHRGTRAMNVALHYPDRMYRFAARLIDFRSRMMGDTKPDFYTGSRQLSEKWCRVFNEKNPDNPATYYQSYASKLRYFFGDLSYLLTYVLVKIYDGDNDGLCPVESAKWANFRGIVTTGGYFGISHGGIIDLYRIKYKGVDILRFYLTMIRELAEKGF
jgi:triacylglycerol lipase